MVPPIVDQRHYLRGKAAAGEILRGVAALNLIRRRNQKPRDAREAFAENK